MKKNIFLSKYVLVGIFSVLLVFLTCLPIHTNAQLSGASSTGGQILSTPSNDPPTVTTGSAIHTQTNATLSGYFSGSATDPTYTEFLWGTGPNSFDLTNSTNFVKQSLVVGDFSQSIGGLTADTQYYYQAVAKNSLGGTNSQPAQILSFRTDPVVQAAPCVVKSFTTNAPNNTVIAYSSVTLSWTKSNCTSLTLSSSDGAFSNTSVLNMAKVLTGSLGSTTSYLLTGTDAAGNISQLSLTVTIGTGTGTGNGTGNGNGNTNTGTCQIYSFTINGSSYAQIVFNGGATLRWNTTPGCTNITISGDNGTNFDGNSGHSLYLFPFNHQVIYTLQAMDQYGVSTSQQVTASVTSNTNNYSGNCNITSFNSSSRTIASGQTVTLTWSTSGSCTSISINGTTGTIPFTYSLPVNGSVATNPLYGTSTFNITANGNVSTTYTPVTVYVTGGPYPYDNGGTNGGNVISSVATNVGAYSVKLNGVFVGTIYPTQAWFEYGTDTNVSATTALQNFDAGVTRAFSDTIITNPKTTYYYRAVAKINGVLSKGSIMSVMTKDPTDTTIFVPSIISNSSSTTSAAVTSTSTGVILSITNKGDKVYVGDTIDFTINYSNNSGKKLSNVGLNITLPQGFTLVQTTKGQTISPTMTSINIGNLASGQSDSIFLQAKVGSDVSLTNTLVTNGTMQFTYPNGSNDSTVGYVLNHAGGVANLGGLSLGAGFFPTTILGWLVTIFIILAVILTIRRITKAKHGTGAMHH